MKWNSLHPHISLIKIPHLVLNIPSMQGMMLKNKRSVGENGTKERQKEKVIELGNYLFFSFYYLF